MTDSMLYHNFPQSEKLIRQSTRSAATVEMCEENRKLVHI